MILKEKIFKLIKLNKNFFYNYNLIKIKALYYIISYLDSAITIK